jgi:hypothetical protein
LNLFLGQRHATLLILQRPNLLGLEV